MNDTEKKALKKNYNGEGELLGMGTIEFDLLKYMDINIDRNRNAFGVPTASDYEITMTFSACMPPNQNGILKVGSGTIHSLSYEREYGISLYFKPENNAGKFTVEFYEKDKK